YPGLAGLAGGVGRALPRARRAPLDGASARAHPRRAAAGRRRSERVDAVAPLAAQAAARALAAGRRDGPLRSERVRTPSAERRSRHGGRGLHLPARSRLLRALRVACRRRRPRLARPLGPPRPPPWARPPSRCP